MVKIFIKNFAEWEKMDEDRIQTALEETFSSAFIIINSCWNIVTN